MLRSLRVCLVVAWGLVGCQPSAREAPHSPAVEAPTGGVATLSAALEGPAEVAGAAPGTPGPTRSVARLAAAARPASVDGSDIPYNGNDNGADVLLQGFHWTSKDFNQNNQRWYAHMKSLLPDIKADFTVVWLPPPASSADGQGYMPADWANLSTPYGSAQELKALIAALHGARPPVKAIADIVINHRSAKSQCSNGVWDQYNYSSFGLGGPDFMDHSLDVIQDGGGKGDNDHMLSGANEGNWSHNGHSYGNEDFSGSSDLNHWNSATRNTVKAWLKWLKLTQNAGFDGWRYDMIGGYDPTFLGEYNFDSQPYLSVGEKPTGDRQTLADMVNRSGNQTMAFDFPMRDSLARALGDIDHMHGNDLGNAGTDNTESGLIGWWSNAAVTFVNNHDTQPNHETVGRTFPWGASGSTSGVTTQAAYAYILTHPGIPSVFIFDWKDRGPDLTHAIDNLIKIRKANGVRRQSRVHIDKAEDGLYAAYVGAQNGEQLAVKIGKAGWQNYESWVPNPALGLAQAYTRFEASGHAYCVYFKNAVAISN